MDTCSIGAGPDEHCGQEESERATHAEHLHRDDARQQVNDCGDDHPTDRRRKWKGSAPQLAQLAVLRFSSYLQSDGEKEDRHQALIDPKADVAPEGERPEVESHRDAPQRLVAVAPRRIGPNERRRRGDEKKDSASRLDLEKPLHWDEGFANEPVVPPATTRAGARAPYDAE